jgi:hypothetical protein
MDARLTSSAILIAATCSLGASHRTENFVVSAPTKAFAVEVATTAERFRHDLAVQWLGRELTPWREPCPIRVHVGDHLGAGGATTFSFQNRRPGGWRMTVQGSQERVLDSVLPHEITHTIFATHFGQPLPRWADEGACTTVEHVSERRAQQGFLIRFLNTERGIPFKQMFAMREYPRDIMPLYSQGFSVVRYLVQHGGERKFIDFLDDGMKANDWDDAVERNYGFDDLSDLQVSWLEWIKKGSPSGEFDGAKAPSPERHLSEAPVSKKTAGIDHATPLGVSSTATKATQPMVAPSRAKTNWYVAQASLATQGAKASERKTRKLPGPTDGETAPNKDGGRWTPPKGNRKILLEWRGEPKPPRWAGSIDRIIR